MKEEELKNRIREKFFNNKSKYDSARILKNIDFCIAKPNRDTKQNSFEGMESDFSSYLWAESKRGKNEDIDDSIIQLILTIGNNDVLNEHLPPIYLGALDEEKIGFIPYEKIQGVFYQNDFNWNVRPSDHNTKEFKELKEKVSAILDSKDKLLFRYSTDEEELKSFIENNFRDNAKKNYILITKNNFVSVYQKWLKRVKPTIDIDWGKAKKQGIVDTDFYFADLFSKDNEVIDKKQSLYIILQKTKYFVKKADSNELGLTESYEVGFSDNQKEHNLFWAIYERPPKQKFWNYIVERRDLLVPQDIRERKGSFFTPQQWVELSQKYLADVLGENWLDEYYIWDCCAGTGNLLNGLTNKYKIWASTIDKADVDVMKDRINNGCSLLKSHIFQMDFLNDDFEEKCPKELLDIINDPEKRKKLVIYINPPYAEATTAKTITRTGKH